MRHYPCKDNRVVQPNFPQSLPHLGQQETISNEQEAQVTMKSAFVTPIYQPLDGILKNRNAMPVAERSSEAHDNVLRREAKLLPHTFPAAPRPEALGIYGGGIQDDSFRWHTAIEQFFSQRLRQDHNPGGRRNRDLLTKTQQSETIGGVPVLCS